MPTYYAKLYHMDPLFATLKIIILIFSVIMHEIMHGLVALKFGDHTAERAGRLTLNPLPHIDPIGSILMPFLFIISGSPFMLGMAKPVPVNPLNFSNLRKGELFVSLAGVGTNFALAAVAAIALYMTNQLGTPSALLFKTLTFTFILNLSLGIFNLLPIPPLDGSKVVLSQLPFNLAKSYERLEPYGLIIIIALLFFTNIFQTILGFFINLFSGILGF